MPGSYCPTCASALTSRLIQGDGRYRLVCDEGHILYENPTVVAGTIPVEHGKVWLLRRSIDPRLGYWTFPAGYMELGEAVDEAALRETREEIGLDVKLGALLNVYSRPEATSVFVVYMAEAHGPAVAQDEALEVQAFGSDELPWDKLAFWSTHRALEDWVETLQSGVESHGQKPAERWGKRTLGPRPPRG